MSSLASREPLVLPPDPVLRAYLELIYYAFLYIRSSGRLGEDQGAFVVGIADAMHNVSHFIAYGLQTDKRFRETYLRPFDAEWAEHPGGVSLEGVLIRFAEDLARHGGNESCGE